MKKPLLLDLFCGAGGCAMGYHRAGFDVVGVDHAPQPNYPFQCFEADAMDFLTCLLNDGTCYGYRLNQFSVIHGSPPCQRYSTMSRGKENHADLYESFRRLCLYSGLPWVIENVMGAPFKYGIVLCGSMFGLKVRRHRNFETSSLILNPFQCQHKKQGRPITVTGHGGGGESKHSFKGIRSEWPIYMGMPWATPQECTQGIPPAYTEFIGKQLLTLL